MTTEDMTRVSVFLPNDLRTRVQATATERGVTQAQLIRAWLEAAAGSARPSPNGGLLVERADDRPRW